MVIISVIVMVIVISACTKWVEILPTKHLYRLVRYRIKKAICNLETFHCYLFLIVTVDLRPTPFNNSHSQWNSTNQNRSIQLGRFLFDASEPIPVRVANLKPYKVTLKEDEIEVYNPVTCVG